MKVFGGKAELPEEAADVSDLRKRIGFPKTISIWLRPAVYMALSPMLVLRGSIGVRMVNGLRLVCLFVVMLLWGLIPSAITAGYQSTGTIKPASAFLLILVSLGCKTETIKAWQQLLGVTRDEILTTLNGAGEFAALFLALMVPMVLFALLMFALGAAHRLMRWIMRYYEERLNSRSLGVSVIPRMTTMEDNGIAERYLDAGLFLTLGIVAWQVSPIVASWIIASAVSLYIVEKYLHELQLDQYDGLLNAEALDQIASLYLSGMTHQGGFDRSSVRPIPTAITRQELARSVGGRGKVSGVGVTPLTATSVAESAVEVSRRIQESVPRLVGKVIRFPWQLVAAAIAALVILAFSEAVPKVMGRMAANANADAQAQKQALAAEQRVAQPPQEPASAVVPSPPASEATRPPALPGAGQVKREPVPAQPVPSKPKPREALPVPEKQPGNAAGGRIASSEGNGVQPPPVTPPAAPSRVPDAGDTSAMEAAIDRGFRNWSRQWFTDRYEPGSAHILKQDGGGAVSGQFSFQRGGQRLTIPFAALLEQQGSSYGLARLCYNDTSTGMRDCAR